jgi:hypothetical protein
VGAGCVEQEEGKAAVAGDEAKFRHSLFTLAHVGGRLDFERLRAKA